MIWRAITSRSFRFPGWRIITRRRFWPLASNKVRYVGEAVVAVVAEDRYLAEDALELIDIEYAPLAAVTDPELAASGDAPLIHEEAATNVLIAREFKKGDVRRRSCDRAMFGSAIASR